MKIIIYTANMKKTIEQFKEHILRAEQHSPHTVRSYITAVEGLGNFLNHKAPSQITKSDLKKFKEYMLKNKTKNKTKNARIYAIRTFIDFLRENDLNTKISKNDISTFGTNGETHHLNLPSDKEIEKFTAPLFFSDHKKESERNNIIVNLFLATGMRSAELLSLRVGQVDTRFSIIGKGNKQRAVFCNKELVERTRRYEEGMKKGEKLFPITYGWLFRIFEERCEWVGISKITPHTLRHVFATRMLSKGVGIRELQEFLGHASITTTQRYLSVSPERLEEIYHSVV